MGRPCFRPNASCEHTISAVGICSLTSLFSLDHYFHNVTLLRFLFAPLQCIHNWCVEKRDLDDHTKRRGLDSCTVRFYDDNVVWLNRTTTPILKIYIFLSAPHRRQLFVESAICEVKTHKNWVGVRFNPYKWSATMADDVGKALFRTLTRMACCPLFRTLTRMACCLCTGVRAKSWFQARVII